MKNKIFALAAALLMLTAWSCREESDALMGYDHNESLAFGDAEKSFAEKFKVLWNGMNQYYAIWDYEKEQGVDWDAVYDEYYPQFVALDQKDSVPDNELQELLDKAIVPLHDGHMVITVKNHSTGHSVISDPGLERLKQRADLKESTVNFNLQYYANVDNGEIETDASGNPIVMEYNTAATALFNQFTATPAPGQGVVWVADKIKELEAKTQPTDLETFQLQQLYDLRNALVDIVNQKLQGQELVNAYNELAERYSFLNIPGFGFIDPGFAKDGIKVQYALLKGNIAYFSMSAFALTDYLDDQTSQRSFDMNNPDTQQHVEEVRKIWQSWFDAVQTLHKNGTLGGVIIDLRTNGGGNMSDSKYVVGSLVAGDNIRFGYQRFKRGTARYDYSPLMPAFVSVMPEPHEAITEPVVILANCQSVSMSETSILCLKTLPNGTFIGRRTYGAICGLIGNEEHSYNYAGHIGVDGVTPVYGYIPSMAAFTLDKKLVEAKGLTPDIEVGLDIDLFKSTGQDTQLDRALQFIRTGN